MIMTPSDIEVLIHCHVSPTPHPRIEAEAVWRAISRFLRSEMIFHYEDDPPGVYTTTERGKAHIHQLCELPVPTRQWTTDKGEVIRV